MHYAQRPPHPHLQPFVEAFWTLSSAGPATLDPVFPDGRSELIVHRRVPFQRVVAGGAPERQSAALVAGQMHAPAFLIAGDDAEVIGARFRPCGAAVFLPLPQHELADQIVDAGALSLPWLTRLTRAAAAAPSPADAVAVLERGLLGRLAGAPAGWTATSAAVDAIVASRGLVTVEVLSRLAGSAVANSSGCSCVTWRCRRNCWRGPALPAGIESAPCRDVDDVAVAHGYADQSH